MIVTKIDQSLSLSSYCFFPGINIMQSESKLKPAVLWEHAAENKVHCYLCSWNCTIADGKLGRCAVRMNIGGELFSLNYHMVCSANADPIEKKPLFHFQPGSQSFSIAAMGCNYRCIFCQNWQISQPAIEKGRIDGEDISPEMIVSTAIKTGCKSIAYTYTEPTIFMELANDCGKIAKQKGLANVFVSNGYMTRQAIDFAAEWLDGINVDLKAFSEDYYKNLCQAHLQPVLDAIIHIAQNTGIWLEVTTLLVPGQNDSDDELKKLTEFLVTNAGPDVPWHISRFYPQYKFLDSDATPIESLEKAAQIGKEAGLRYIYLGNAPHSKAESTYCHNCTNLLIERVGYRILANNIQHSACPQCNTQIPGYQLG